MIVTITLVAGCRDKALCEVDADCDRYADAVCHAGRCACAGDELQRCLCDVQSRCDDIYGVGLRQCIDGACRECSDNDDCERLQQCGAQGECEAIECLDDGDCAVGFCNSATRDCVGCREPADCPASVPVCRHDGACVGCTDIDHCGASEVCDIDVVVNPEVEIVGTNQCGLDCSPRCREECSDDPQCVTRPACVVEDPDCLRGTCETWDDCELPETCALRLGECPQGGACEALAQSFLVPVYYACLPTPCLYDFECEADDVCYEGRCLRGCASDGDCADGSCVARVHFEGAACVD